MGRLSFGDQFVGAGGDGGVEAQIADIQAEAVVDLDDIRGGHGAVKHVPDTLEVAAWEVEDDVLRGAAEIKDGHSLVGAEPCRLFAGSGIAYQPRSHTVDDAVAAAGYETDFLFRMQVAVEADIARGIALAHGSIDHIRVRDFLQLGIEITVVRNLIGPSIYDVDIFHTRRLIIVMSSL